MKFVARITAKRRAQSPLSPPCEGRAHTRRVGSGGVVVAQPGTRQVPRGGESSTRVRGGAAPTPPDPPFARGGKDGAVNVQVRQFRHIVSHFFSGWGATIVPG